MTTLINDVKFAIRQLRKNPGFTAIAVISLALGIGAGTAVFSLVNAIMLRSLPVPNPQELRIVKWAGTDVRMPSYSGNSNQDGSRWISADSVTYPTFLRLREQAAGKADVFGFHPLGEVAVGIQAQTFAADGMMVSENFFSGLNVRPCLGRLLQEGEDYDAAMNAMISYAWWEKHFALDPGVLGQGIELNGTPFTIVGVLPRGFVGVQPGDPPGFYVPLSIQSPFRYRGIAVGLHWFVRLMARMSPGTSDAQLKAALDATFAHEVARSMKEPWILVKHGRGGVGYDRSSYRKPLLLMLGVVGLVTLVACANLAGLSLARGASREHEVAVCVALGAGRWRLIRQALTESLLIASFGGVLGLALAIWGRSAIARLLVGPASELHYDVSLDLTVLGFTSAAVLIVGLLSGLLPALRASRVNPVGGLKNRGTLGVPRLKTGKILVATQICLSLLLLSAAGLYLRTLVNLTRIDAGFNVERLLLVRLNIHAGRYANAHPAQFYERVQNSVVGLPGVQAATLVEFPLLANLGSTGSFSEFSGGSANPPAKMQTRRLTVSETFFTTMGIPILQGRGLKATDTGEASKVVVVNESFVRNYLPNENPIGLTFRVWSADWRIVGVCRDAKYGNIKEPVQPTTYLPLRQRFYDRFHDTHLRNACIAVRTALPPLALSAAVRKAVAQIDPGVAVTKITTQEDMRDQGISPERLLATLCCALGGLTLFLACIGLYGLMAYNVARRTSEIGIRMALGATRQDIAWHVLHEAVLLTLAGVAVGVPVALALSRLIKSQLYDVEPNDPFTLVAAVFAMLLVAALAAWIPARRAAKIDPMEALRYE